MDLVIKAFAALVQAESVDNTEEAGAVLREKLTAGEYDELCNLSLADVLYRVKVGQILSLRAK